MKLNGRTYSLLALSLSALLGACGADTSEADTTAEAPAAEQPAETPSASQAMLDLSNVTLPEGVTAEMVNSGAELYPTQACTACHMAEATGGPLAPNLTDDEWINIDGSFDAIVETITNGVAEPQQYPSPMLARGGTNMTDEQIRDVAAYIFAISHGASM